jgi:thiamine biosynthesis lipoprotein
MTAGTTVTTVTIARHAMATRFEILLHGEIAARLRAAAEEALDEIERLDAQLSPFRPGSEISRLNAHAGHRPMRIEPGLFNLLQKARQISFETGGAFDLTVGPLMDCWGLSGSAEGPHPAPKPENIAAARALTGMDKLLLDEAQCTAGLALPGMRLDLGAYGKGWAVERAGLILREAGVTSALIHGGTSTVCAIGTPPDASAWNIALEKPDVARRNRSWSALVNPRSTRGQPVDCSNPDDQPFAVIPLKDEALSVSATWGKEIEVIGSETRTGHVIDPHLGHPIPGALMAAVVLPLASETDAFSTALLVTGSAGKESIQRMRPSMRTFLVA